VNWFAVANVALMALIGLRYLWHYAPLEPWVGWTYAALAYVGHWSALTYLPLLLLLTPVLLLFPRPRLVLPLGVLLAAAGLSLLLLDSLVFAENRYHLGVVTFLLFETETWAFLAVYFVVFLALESMLAGWFWRRSALPTRRIGRYLALGAVGCFVASHIIYAWAMPYYYVPITAFARYLPQFYQLVDTRLLMKAGLVERNQAREQGVVAALRRPPDRLLNYPLARLRCEPKPPLLNVLLIVIDAMRADALSGLAAPRLTDFASGAVRFDAHYSGGNSSRAGMFSLFYGLPATYWDAFADFTRTPTLMDLFREFDYQLGVFASSPLYREAVALDRTALAHIPNLRRETHTRYPGSSGRDRTLTEDWYEWLDHRDAARPFFGFLYYNAAVAMEPPANYRSIISVSRRASPQARLYARYLTAVHFVDSLVGGVLDDLTRRGLLDHTVVLVTSDHGMEFDENGLGFSGHGTAYSELQLHSPLLVRWPGRPSGRVTRRTSHNDIAPTLLTGIFGCTNPPSDYASGHGLFTDAQWDWLIAASYSDFALVEPDRVTVVLPAGYEIRDHQYRLVPHPTLSRDSLRAALREMSRFFR
jgi:uncharacterized protein